ncbi:TPA: FAD-dependent oxidoreductase [Proteus mirabilis]|nr:FAD-dependent oxidoreductase [Proteus mirabilis]
MTDKIVIAGSGFAGFWASISAMRAISQANKENDIKVILVSPKPNLTIRPRLYEKVLDNMSPNISKQLSDVGVEYISGKVEKINTESRTLEINLNNGETTTLTYHRFILATGSQLATLPIKGFKEYGFSVDTLEDAQQLEKHLYALKNKPESDARNTVIVVGAGLTGLETAAEMPSRLKAILGDNVRVVIIGTASRLAEGMGSDASIVIQQALSELGVDSRTDVRVEAIGDRSIQLSNGECIESNTVILATGVKASTLTKQISNDQDISGRIVSDIYLRVKDAPEIFVAGDTVKAPTDDKGHFNLMTCQHALSLGRVAGYNAAAELIGIPLHPYSQPKYVTCLDLGDWGALYTEGWERRVCFIKEEGKKIKQEINTQWIYPPELKKEELFAIANPDYIIVP